MFEFVVDKENFNGFVKSILCDGKSPYTGQAKEDFIKQGYSVMTNDELYDFKTQWEDKTLIGKWKEVSEEEYNDQLNILPPLDWRNGGFFMSEIYIGDVSSFYQRWNDKYYTSFQRVDTPREKIIESLQTFIKGA